MHKPQKPWRDRLYQNIALLFLIVLLPSLVLGAYSYLHTEHAALSNAGQTVNRQIANAVGEIDKRLADIVAMRRFLSNDHDLISLELKGRADSADALRMTNVQSLFADTLALNDYLFEIFLYNGQGKIVSSSGIFPSDYYFAEYRRFEGYTLESFHNMLNTRANMRYLPASVLTQNILGRYTAHRVLPLLTTVTTSQGRGLLFFIIDTQSILDTLRKYVPYTETYYTVTDAQNKIATDTLPDQAQDFLSFSYLSPQNGWQYSVRIAKHEITGASQQMLMIILSVLFLGVLLALKVSSLMYQPLRNIKTMLGDTEKKAPEKESGGLERLEKQVAKLTQNTSDARVQLNALARTYAEDAFLSQTLTENKVSMLETVMTRYLGFHGGPYQCAALRLTKADPQAEETVRSIFAKYFPVCSIGYDERIVLLILETGSIHGKNMIETAAHELLSKLPGIALSVAVGCEITHVQALNKSINTSLTVLQLMEQNGRGTLCFSEDFDISAQYVFTYKDEWTLVEALQRNEEERMHHHLDNILLKNYEKNVSYQQIQHLFEQLRDTAYRYAQQEGLSIPPRTYDRSASFDAMRKELHGLYAILLTDTDAKTRSAHLQLPIDADKYINEHYAQDIYLDTVAKALGVSAKHLSKIYKQQRNINITDQMSFVRVERAKELLKDTDLTITAIMRLTGFVSRATFLRSFKKYTDISPSIYRQLHNPSVQKEEEAEKR